MFHGYKKKSQVKFNSGWRQIKYSFKRFKYPNSLYTAPTLMQINCKSPILSSKVSTADLFTKQLSQTHCVLSSSVNGFIIEEKKQTFYTFTLAFLSIYLFSSHCLNMFYSAKIPNLNKCANRLWILQQMHVSVKWVSIAHSAKLRLLLIWLIFSFAFIASWVKGLFAHILACSWIFLT